MDQRHQVILIILGLVVFGVLMVYDASSAQALQQFNDKYYFVKDQIKWVALGLAGATIASFFDYRALKHLAVPILIGCLVSLIAVFLPGIGVHAYGASRWINLGFTVIQPSELAKLSLIIYLAAWLTTKEKGRLLPFFLLVGLLVGLIILEPDMGTAIVLFGTALVMYYLSDSSLLGLLSILPVVLTGGILLALKSPYRLKRIVSFLDPESDPFGASYHIRQALIALGSGGFLGLGLGNSRQKYSYLPEAMTDSIFAIIGEELGLIGTTALVVVFGVLFVRAIRLTLLVDDTFGRLLGMGIVSYLAIQTLVNFGSIVGLIPLTGVPLPFLSYGGSALIVELVSVGILVNIWKVHRR
ncbi:putative lipid II flippase FtsW [Candidatus Microgenomates bacterium]|nr:putative lipid II flippase FtsW [Candidatus Microgenomates bacterium]